MRHRSDSIAIDISNIPRDLVIFTQTQIDRALTSFTGQFDTLKVGLAGRDKSANVTCEIKVRLVRSGVWIIQAARDRNAYAAIENAAAAMARTLGRALARVTSQPLTTAA